MQAASLTYQAEVEVETESDTDPLPDQPINPEEYEPVLLTTEEHNEELMRRLIPVNTYDGFDVFSDSVHKLKVCNYNIVKEICVSVIFKINIVKIS